MATRVFTKTILPEKLLEELHVIFTDGLVQSIETEGTSVTVDLSRDPTGQEDTDLTNAVNSHVPTYKNYKIWEYVQEPKPKHLPPMDLDFNSGLTIRLHPKKTFVKGERTKIEYFVDATVDPNTGAVSFSNPILEETYSFVRDPGGFAVARPQTIQWYLDDDTLGPDSKVTMKYYAGIDKIKEGKTRRTNLVDILMMDIANMLLYVATVAKGSALTGAEIGVEIQKGRELLSEYSNSFSDFKGHSDKQILTDIANDSNHTFIDSDVPGSSPAVTIRDYIIAEMTI